MARIIALSGDVGWEITANKIRAELKEAKGKDVEFHINSPGGFVSEGIEIFNVIRAYKGGTVAVIVGVAASMGSYIPLACDKVIAYDNAIYMIHNPWSYAVGDYQDMGKAFEMLKGMAGLLAKEYAKKTGRLVDKMQTFMDDETFFFGNEMKAEGFVDDIIDAPDDSANDDDKGAALIIAKASIGVCVDRMRDTDAANADIERAVAYVNGMSALLDVSGLKEKPADAGIENNPAGAGGKSQEDNTMTLEELLAANAGARAQHDKMVADARKEGAESVRASVKATMAKVGPILASDAYDKITKQTGIDAITGEKSIGAFEAVVAVVDREIEKAKEEAAKAEQGGETVPGAGTEAEQAAADFAAKKERMS